MPTKGPTQNHAHREAASLCMLPLERASSVNEYHDGFSLLLPLLYLRAGRVHWPPMPALRSLRQEHRPEMDQMNSLTVFTHISYILAVHHTRLCHAQHSERSASSTHTYPRFMVQDCKEIHCIVIVLPLQRASTGGKERAKSVRHSKESR